MRERVNITISPELLRRVRELAELEQRAFSAQVSVLLAKALDLESRGPRVLDAGATRPHRPLGDLRADADGHVDRSVRRRGVGLRHWFWPLWLLALPAGKMLLSSSRQIFDAGDAPEQDPSKAEELSVLRRLPKWTYAVLAIALGGLVIWDSSAYRVHQHEQRLVAI